MQGAAQFKPQFSLRRLIRGLGFYIGSPLLIMSVSYIWRIASGNFWTATATIIYAATYVFVVFINFVGIVLVTREINNLICLNVKPIWLAKLIDAGSLLLSMALATAMLILSIILVGYASSIFWIYEHP